MRDYNERLLDILEAIENIEKYTLRGHEAFEHDELIQPWIVHHLQIIGEAACALLTLAKHTQRSKKKISGLLLHG
jgi:uncharacterized protein with HEPN domain